MGRMLSGPPCCPARLTAGGCYLWSKTGKRVLTAQVLNFAAARVSQSLRGLLMGTAKDPGMHPLPPALLLRQRWFGRGEDGQLRAAAALQQSYWSSAKGVLTYHYYWWCCYHYYCYYYIPLLICPKETEPALLYIAAVPLPPTNVSCHKCWSYSGKYDASF